MAFTAVLAVVYIGLLVASYFLLKPKKVDKPLSDDDTPTTLVSYGSFLSYVIGRQLVGHAFCWTWNRWSQEEELGSSAGGSGKDGGSASQTVWYESAWHPICPNTGNPTLYGIYANNKLVYAPDPPLTPENAPSGTSVDIPGIGTIVISWGLNSDDYVDAELSAQLEVASRWPGVIFIKWINRRLGGSPTWEVHEYDIECMPSCQDLLNAPYLLDNGNGARGVNPMHALLQLYTGTEEYGCGIDPDLIDLTSAETCAAFFYAEHLPMNLTIENGQTVESAIQSILADAGMMQVVINGKLAHRLLRDPEDTAVIPLLDNDIISAPDAEVEIVTRQRRANRVVFMYKRRDFSWRDYPIPIDNDAFAFDDKRYKQIQIGLGTVSDHATASKIADRRSQEPLGDAGFIRMQAIRHAALLSVGDAFTTSDIGPLRVMAKQHDVFSPTVTLECSLDSYAIPGDESTPDLAPPSSPLRVPPENDLAVSVFEHSSSTSINPTISIFRIRGNDNVTESTVWGSIDGFSYQTLGRQSASACGGPILEDFLSEKPILEDGPVIEALNDDIDRVLDLSSEEGAWRSGRQVVLIGSELMFLRNVSAIPEDEWQPATKYELGDSVIPADGVTGFRYVCTKAGGSDTTEPTWPDQLGDKILDGTAQWTTHGFRFQLHGLIRGRMGTPIKEHPAGSVAFIAKWDSLTPIKGAVIRAGATLSVKSQPGSLALAVDLSSVPPVVSNIQGKAYADLTFLALSLDDFLVTEQGDNIIL